MLVHPSNAAVMPILSFYAIFLIDCVNILVDCDKTWSLILFLLGNFKAGAIKAKTSFVSWFSKKMKGNPFEICICKSKVSKYAHLSLLKGVIHNL